MLQPLVFARAANSHGTNVTTFFFQQQSSGKLSESEAGYIPPK
jgi:hypothetical protein